MLKYAEHAHVDMYKHKPQPKPIESSRQKFVKNGLRAVARSESYDFRSSADSIPLSAEMLSIKSSKSLCFSKPDDFWSNRYSALAAPMGAEMYLSCERNIPETVMGGPRYYMKEVLDGLEPNARPRFPYDDTAHAAAKQVTAQYKKNLRLRHEAAKAIQKIWRGHRVFLEYLPIFIQRAEAAGKIHDEYRGKKFSLLTKLRRRTELRRLSLLPPPRAPPLSQEEVDRRYREKLAMKLTRFVKMIPKLLRKQRGRRRRVAIHATRLQSLYRGNEARERVWKMISAQIMIACVYRRFFKRKYITYILKIQRTYRNYLLRRLVILIQKHCRGFTHRRRASKLKLRISAEERLRGTLERALLKECIKNAATAFFSLHGLEVKAGKFRKWKRKMVGKAVDPAPPSHVYHTLSTNMLFFDPVEICAIQNHFLNVQEIWPKPPFHLEGDQDETAPARVGAVREKITSVFSRYEYVQGKYLAEPAAIEAEPEDEEVAPDEEVIPVKKGSAKSSRSGRGTPSGKPGSANTGKFASGPKTPGSAKTPSSKKSAASVKFPVPPKTPTSAYAGARSGSGGKTASAKSQRTPTSKGGSTEQSPSKKRSSSGKSNSSFKSPTTKSSGKNVSHDDWAPGSIGVGSQSDVVLSNNPEDYYNKKEKLMWLMLDSFTNWKLPRIDGFSLLICQEFLERRTSVDGLRDKSLFRKLMPCGFSPAPQVSAPKIHSELQTPPFVSTTHLSMGHLIEPKTSSEPAVIATPKAESPAGFPPGATADSVTRLGLDKIDCEGGDEYQLDALPCDNWGMALSSPQRQASECGNDFGWSPEKNSSGRNVQPFSPRDPGPSSKLDNVFDTTTNTSQKISMKLERSSSKLVQFMGSKKTVPAFSTPRTSENRKSVKSDVPVSPTKASTKEGISVKKSEKESVKKKKKSNKFQSFTAPQTSSKFSNISETLRPTSSSKSSPQKWSQKSKYPETSTKSMKSAKTLSEKDGRTSSKKSIMSDLIIPEKQEALKERVKFILPDVVPRSPRCAREIPTIEGFSAQLDLYKCWDRYSIFLAYLPIKKLQFSVNFWKTAPDAVVAKAIFVRKWTLYFDNIFKIFIEKHRVRNPPRRHCPRCLMPSYVDIRRSHECSSNYFPLSWVSKNTWDPAVDVLVEGCSALTASKFDKRLSKQINTNSSEED